MAFRQLEQLVPEFDQFLRDNAPPAANMTLQARADLLGDVLDAGTCCTHHEGHLAREDVDLVAKVHCTPFASDWGPYLDRRVLVDGEVFEDLRHVYQVQPPLGQGDDDRGRAVLPVLAVADEYVYAESDDVRTFEKMISLTFGARVVVEYGEWVSRPSTPRFTTAAHPGTPQGLGPIQ